MTHIKIAAGLTLAILSLSACSKPATPPADGSSAAATTTATTSGGGNVLAALGNGPGLKAGLWQMTTKVAGMTSGMVTKMCLDEGLSKKFADMGTSNPGKMDCSPVSATRSGGVIDIATKCTSDGLTVNNKMHMEMTGDDAYHQTVEQSYEPKMSEPTTTQIDGKYLGACGADMKAGDMEMGGGVKINMYDVAAKHKG